MMTNLSFWGELNILWNVENSVTKIDLSWAHMQLLSVYVKNRKHQYSALITYAYIIIKHLVTFLSKLVQRLQLFDT